MSSLTNLAIAYHEAGHALAHFRLNLPMLSISVIADAKSFGRVRGFSTPAFFRKFDQEQPSRMDISKAHDWIVALLAGKEAQSRFRPGSIRPAHIEHDNSCIQTILERLFHEAERGPLMKYLRIRATLLVRNPTNWRMISDLAEVLIDRRSMNGQEAVALFRESLGRQLRERRGLARNEGRDLRCST